jgi:hypothetical protein
MIQRVIYVSISWAWPVALLHAVPQVKTPRSNYATRSADPQELALR